MRLGERLQCLNHVVGVQHGIPMRPQQPRQAPADARIVIDEKDGCAQGRGTIIRLEAVNVVETSENECEPRRTSEAVHSPRLILESNSHSRGRVMLHCHRGRQSHETLSHSSAYRYTSYTLGVVRSEHS